MEILYKFLTYVGAIALVYLAQTLFKIKQTRKNGSFSWKVLLDGLIDHLIFFAGVMCLFASGIVLPEVKIATINNIEVNMVDALCMVAIALYVKQGFSALNNVKDNYGVDNIEVKKIETIDFNLASDYEEKAKNLKG